MCTQDVDELRHTSSVADFKRNSRAIKIGAKGYSLDTQALNQVIEMAHQYLKRHIGVTAGILPQVVDAEIDADQPA